MSSLEELRSDLSKLTLQMLESWQRRKSLVQQIQLQKDNTIEYFCFAPQVEYKLFQQFLPKLKLLSIKELLAYSLLIESHAQISEKSYPAWSERVHLKQPYRGDLIEQINPILLASVHQSLYDKLPINQKFQALLSFAR